MLLNFSMVIMNRSNSTTIMRFMCVLIDGRVLGVQQVSGKTTLILIIYIIIDLLFSDDINILLSHT